MTTSPRTMKLSKVMKNLALRNNADLVFDSVENSKEKEVILDFSDIQFMSRSFAQQYLLRKRASKKSVKEINVPEEIAKMFEIVKRRRTKSHFSAKNFKVIKVVSHS